MNNPADRDHCIQYMVAIPLLFGRLTAADYEDGVAQDKRIDALREKINCFEDPAFTADYHDPEKRAIANAITLEFTDGSRFEEVVVEYPIGHARRRNDGMPKLVEKFKINPRVSSRPVSSSASGCLHWTELARSRCRSMSIWTFM